MIKFWRWMEDEKGYSKCSFGLWNKLNGYEDKEKTIPLLIEPTKQMLIGYMFEYLLDNGFEDTHDILSDCFVTDSNEIYYYIKDIIKEIE